MHMVTRHDSCRLLNGPKPLKSDFLARIDGLWEQMEPNSIAVVVSNPERTRSNDTEYVFRQSSDMLYLNGFPEPESVLVLCKLQGQYARKNILFVRPKDRLSEIWNGVRIGVEGAKKEYFADLAYDVATFESELRPLLARAQTVYYRYGVNEQFDKRFDKMWRPWQKQLLNYDDILHEMRLIKSENELALIRHACEITAEAHRQAMLATRPGAYEYQVQAALEYVFRFHGAAAPAYGSIVATGENAVVLHYTNNDQQIRDGDLLLVDAAGEYGNRAGGYASDITRCWPANGKFSEAQAEIYQLVLDAQKAAIACIKPGVPLAATHFTAERVLRAGLKKLGILPPESTAHAARRKPKAGEAALPTLRDYYMHGTSHWLGLDVHDVGRYQTFDNTRSDKGRGKRRVLEPGMVFTVEPGLYFDKDDTRVPEKYRGIGVRIEDDVVVTADGCEILTAAVPKEIDAIEALMAQRV